MLNTETEGLVVFLERPVLHRGEELNRKFNTLLQCITLGFSDQILKLLSESGIGECGLHFLQRLYLLIRLKRGGSAQMGKKRRARVQGIERRNDIFHCFL